jgi:hypothetical protein
LEIRNLTSHHLRTWTALEERRRSLSYSLPSTRIYWQILPADALKGTGLDAIDSYRGEGPVMLFHKKPPSEGRFQIGDDYDRASTLLAIARLSDTGKGARRKSNFVAREPYGGGSPFLEALKVQQIGNVTLSPHYRPRRDLEFHWGFASGMDMDKLNDRLGRTGPITGSIRIVSPSRSLGTADQGPLPGEPVDSCDFPARITYAINYNIAINDEVFVDDQAGIAIAVGVDDVPPRDVKVAFDKPHIGHVLDRYLEFGVGDCTGMKEITQEEYDHGVNFCRYWRSVPLDPDPARWADFRDFDPSREY